MPLESSLLLKLGRSNCMWLCVFADGFLHQYHTAKNESPLYALTALTQGSYGSRSELDGRKDSE